jgi:hypothetical protein
VNDSEPFAEKIMRLRVARAVGQRGRAAAADDRGEMK